VRRGLSVGQEQQSVQELVTTVGGSKLQAVPQATVLSGAHVRVRRQPAGARPAAARRRTSQRRCFIAVMSNQSSVISPLQLKFIFSG
jgi:hypothetical protein